MQTPTAMAAPHSSASQALKAALRDRMRRLRAEQDPAAAGARLAAHLLERLPPPAGAVVAGYWPLAGEIDIRPLLHALHERGHEIALPETPPVGAPLAFHRWRPGATLTEGPRRTFHPAQDPVVPDILLVPLLAFDRAGHRLGYGAGYYDRTLAALSGRTAIGCGFATQEVEAVPAEAHDRRLDAIATEAGLIFPE